MDKKVVILLILCGMILSACSGLVTSKQTLTGSGKVVSEPRSMTDFRGLTRGLRQHSRISMG